jgi:ubiquinol-cytochrome c reductase iron-sulfur subunit
MSEASARADNSKRTWLIAVRLPWVLWVAATVVPLSAPSSRPRRPRRPAPRSRSTSALRPGEKVTWSGAASRCGSCAARPSSWRLEKVSANWPTPSPSAPAGPRRVRAQPVHRSIKPEVLVAVGICSHLGCSPSDKFQTGAQPSLPDDWAGGFLCPCHGSTFDMAGRVFKNKPAPDNLEVPPHTYLSDTILLSVKTRA